MAAWGGELGRAVRVCVCVCVSQVQTSLPHSSFCLHSLSGSGSVPSSSQAACASSLVHPGKGEGGVKVTRTMSSAQCLSLYCICKAPLSLRSQLCGCWELGYGRLWRDPVLCLRITCGYSWRLVLTKDARVAHLSFFCFLKKLLLPLRRDAVFCVETGRLYGTCGSINWSDQAAESLHLKEWQCG